jgi:hypothetical protein
MMRPATSNAMRTYILRVVRTAGVVVLVWFAAESWFVRAYNARPGLNCTIKAPEGISRGIVHLREADTETIKGYAWRIRVLSVSEKSASVVIQALRFPDGTSFAAMSRGLDTAAPQYFEYKPCSELVIPVDGAAPLLLSGFTSSPCLR